MLLLNLSERSMSKHWYFTQDSSAVHDEVHSDIVSYTGRLIRLAVSSLWSSSEPWGLFPPHNRHWPAGGFPRRSTQSETSGQTQCRWTWQRVCDTGGPAPEPPSSCWNAPKSSSPHDHSCKHLNATSFNFIGLPVPPNNWTIVLHHGTNGCKWG